MKKLVVLVLGLVLILSFTLYAADNTTAPAGNNPGNTGMPFYYGYFDSSGNKISGTNTLNSQLDNNKYLLSISGETFSPANFQVIVTPISQYPVFATVTKENDKIGVRLFNPTGSQVFSDFQVMVYKTGNNDNLRFYKDSDRDTFGLSDDYQYLPYPQFPYTADRGGDTNDNDPAVNPLKSAPPLNPSATVSPKPSLPAPPLPEPSNTQPAASDEECTKPGGG